MVSIDIASMYLRLVTVPSAALIKILIDAVNFYKNPYTVSKFIGNWTLFNQVKDFKGVITRVSIVMRTSSPFACRYILARLNCGV